MMKKILLIAGAVGISVVAVLNINANTPKKLEKINGVSFVAPPRPIERDQMLPIKQIDADWTAIIPYAFSKAGLPEVNFGYEHQWWGEQMEGAAKTIEYSKDLGMKVMLKPHVWVMQQGWAGDFDLDSEEKWQRWEKGYSNYILSYAQLADSMNVEVFCIGTEFRKAVVKRPKFWKMLIQDVREIYSGDVTYAANWDNFHNVDFWAELDYIGIDGYFPLSDAKTPTVNHLVTRWDSVVQVLNQYHIKYEKPILFTEFGYQSIDYATDGHWKYNKDTLSVNLEAQSNAYEALFQALWNKEWFAGGFLWKWHSGHEHIGGASCKEFTPQNKPTEVTIKKWYGQKKSQTSRDFAAEGN